MIEPTERCAACGSIKVKVSDVELDIWSSLKQSFRIVKFHRFECERCGEKVDVRVLK